MIIIIIIINRTVVAAAGTHIKEVSIEFHYKATYNIQKKATINHPIDIDLHLTKAQKR